MPMLQHGYPFDPSYGYDLERLLVGEPPPEPPGFADLWSARYEKALRVDPRPILRPCTYTRPGVQWHSLTQDQPKPSVFPLTH